MSDAIKYFLQGFTNPFSIDESTLPETKNLGEISSVIYRKRLEILKVHHKKAKQIKSAKKLKGNINAF